MIFEFSVQFSIEQCVNWIFKILTENGPREPIRAQTLTGSLFERAQIHRIEHIKLVNELSELLPLDEVVSMLHETEINQWGK